MECGFYGDLTSYTYLALWMYVPSSLPNGWADRDQTWHMDSS